MWRILAIAGAVLLHAGFILFGGLLFGALRPETPRPSMVELLGQLEADKPKETPKEPPPEQEPEPDKAPDVAEVVKSLDQQSLNDPPALSAMSLGALEQALGGGPGSSLSEALSLATGGRIGGTGRGGAVDRIEAAFSMSEIDQKPRVVWQATPLFPAELRGRRVEGDLSVTLVFVVDSNGRVQSPRVEKASHPALERPALEAARQWKFEPAVKGGQRVSCRMRQQIRFQPT
jgi:protein TonB